MRASGFVPPLYGRIHQELRCKGMTLMLLWQEHVSQHLDEATHRYSQSCENYRRFARYLKRSMRQTHRAGEKLFIDFAGRTVGLIDGSRAHIFVAALGASGYTFVCATPRERRALERAMVRDAASGQERRRDLATGLRRGQTPQGPGSHSAGPVRRAASPAR